MDEKPVTFTDIDFAQPNPELELSFRDNNNGKILWQGNMDISLGMSLLQNYSNNKNAFLLNAIYLFVGISLFYYSFSQARKKGSLINVGE